MLALVLVNSRSSMAKSLAQIRQRIESLKKEAEQMRKSEVAGDVARIKEAIRRYELTPEDLGLVRTRKAVARKGRARAAGSAVATYQDSSSGRTWTGHGRRPQWLIDALAAGRTPEDMAV
jgi:DNA-binding protein H-NS